MIKRLFVALIAGVLLTLGLSAPVTAQMTLGGAGTGAGAWGSAGGGAGCSQATSYLSGLTTSFTTAYQTMICGLVTDGVFASLDRLYVFATDNSTNALKDIIGGSAATVTGAPTFTANSGYVGVPASNSTVNTGLNYSTATNFKQNSGMIAAWATNGTTNDNNCPIGSNGLSSSTTMQTFNFSGQVSGGINAASAGINITVATGTGLTAFDRSTATLTTAYRNGSSIGTAATVSQAVANESAAGLECAGTGSTFAENVGMIAVGASLGATNQLALYNRVHTFLHTVNAGLYP